MFGFKLKNLLLLFFFITNFDILGLLSKIFVVASHKKEYVSAT